MIKPLVTSSKELKVKCIPVKPGEDISTIVTDLEDTLKTLKGYALASNQIGYNKQIAVVRMIICNIVLVNPIILSKNGKIRFNESCLSFPGLRILTDRYNEIVVESGAEEEKQRYSLSGLEAVVIQHEIDHLNGLTMMDRKHRKQR